MNLIWLIIPALLLLAITAQAIFAENRLYKYKAKKYMMTRAEADLYRKLSTLYGKNYVIVPQVHLSAILDEKVRGQNWRAAFYHINGKSVDFVILDKKDLTIRAAIECDDYTHDQKDRKKRDTEVNRIFKDAGVSLFRLKNTLRKTPEQIKKDIDNYKT